MLERLRWKLTLWFVGLSFLLYLGLSVSVMTVFDSQLNSLLDDELRGLAREIHPSIDMVRPTPTLKPWAEHARQDSTLLATIQIFDAHGTLLEEYGPRGIPHLFQGTQSESSNTVRSLYRPLSEMGVPNGFLQIQLPTKSKDSAMKHLLSTLMMLAPFLIAGLGICGYIFSGKALKPTEQSIALLRRFIADAGHEFTTPISVIQASLETLEKRLDAQGMSTEILHVVRRATDRIAKLGQDLMLLAKLESPTLTAPLESVQIDEIVQSVCEEFKPAFQSRQLKLILKDFQPCQMLAYAETLRTMVSHVIENAMTYTEPGGSVSVGVEERSGQVEISIEDTGIGIPPSSIDRIFDRFYRVDKSRSRARGGSGLGLAIVKASVEAHAGIIKTESTVGKGTKFTILLPLRGVPNVST